MIEVPAPCSARHYDSLNNFSARLLESKVMPADGLHRQWWRPAGMLQFTATHCNALQRTATHCNALQRTATHDNTLKHKYTLLIRCKWWRPAGMLQHTATHYIALQHIATHCNSL